MRLFRKCISLLLALVLCAGLAVTAQAADTKEARAVIGADLSDGQINEVYKMFGIEKGSVDQLTVTNDEEREYLAGVVSDSTIGTKSISCVYIQLLDEGEGLEISTENINWCTTAIYENALVTAGIYDAKVKIAAPFAVSGTAALTGIYKAYEDMTGKALSDDAKQTAVEELVITSEIADDIGSADATEVVNELKKMLNETASMTDDELRQEIINIADQCNVTLTDDQISQLISLVRSLEKLDADVLISKVESIQNTVKKLSEMGDKAGGFFASVKNFFVSIGNWFSNLFK